MSSLISSIERPCALSLAGFDPSGGAGIMADTKTFESLKVYGTGVVTAITAQTDETFSALEWVDRNIFFDQLEVILKRFPLRAIKFGIIESAELLLAAIVRIKEQYSDAKIVWDPVVQSSTGYPFHDRFEPGTLEQIFACIDVVTPNSGELDRLSEFLGCSRQVCIELISRQGALYLTGSDSSDEEVRELLVVGAERYEFSAPRLVSVDKHGSGCVFSSAVAGFLAHGWSLYMACKRAGEYSRELMKSSRSQFGFHQSIADVREEVE